MANTASSVLAVLGNRMTVITGTHLESQCPEVYQKLLADKESEDDRLDRDEDEGDEDDAHEAREEVYDSLREEIWDMDFYLCPRMLRRS